MTRSRTRLLIAALALSAAASAGAGESELTGLVGLDGRAFWEDPRFERQYQGGDASVFLQPEFYWRSSDGRQRVSMVGFGRLDSRDKKRSHADLREGYWGYEADDWDLVLGVNKVFWGVTESRHLVDVINQTDLVEDIDQEDKLGQPMINLNLERDNGRFELYVLPGFRERTFPGEDGRFGLILPVDTNNPVYESSAEGEHVDFALRYSRYVGDIDLGIHVFRGTSREPGFVLAPQGDRLLPVYEQMTQLGLDLQYTRDAWLWKLEVIGRDAESDAFGAAVGGFEYTFFGVRDSAMDYGLLIEYLNDDRSPDAPPTVFDNDLFVATRLAFNDAADTSVLAGLTTDVDTNEVFFNLEAERRLGDNLSAELRVRAFANADPGDDLFTFARDDYVQLRVSWYY